MYQNKTILGFIGARGGSKGLPNKNTLDLGGKPLIAWTIEASLGSAFIDRTIVSTDSDDIARVAKKWDADVPFMRPADLAGDRSLIDDAIRQGLKTIREQEHRTYDYVMLLQPTSPLRASWQIDDAVAYYFDHVKDPKDTLVSVSPVPSKFGWILTQDKKGYVKFGLPITKNQRNRQQLDSLYLPNGQIFFAPVKVIEEGSFYGENTLPYVMDDIECADIDTREDLDRVRDIIANRRTTAAVWRKKERMHDDRIENNTV